MTGLAIVSPGVGDSRPRLMLALLCTEGLRVRSVVVDWADTLSGSVLELDFSGPGTVSADFGWDVGGSEVAVPGGAEEGS